MTGLLIVGASGHGKVIAESAQATGSWSRLAFTDDRWDRLDAWQGIPVIGPARPVADRRPEYAEAVVAIGHAATRLEIMDAHEALGYRLAVVVHPSAVLSPSARLGAGSVVLAQAAVNAEARLGRGCIVNTGASVDHDCRLGDGVHVCPGAALAGDVHVGARTWIGIGAAICQGVAIGSDVIIAAGAVVVDDVADGVTVMGVPARPAGTPGPRERDDA